MLTHREVEAVADDLCNEAKRRNYVNNILAAGLIDEPQAWQLVIELMEVVLHRRGLYIVPQSRIKEAAA